MEILFSIQGKIDHVNRTIEGCQSIKIWPHFNTNGVEVGFHFIWAKMLASFKHSMFDEMSNSLFLIFFH